MIGDQAIDEIKEQVGQLLESYSGPINTAYLKNPGELAIGFIVKLSPGKKTTETIIETGMSFVAERVKDKTKSTIDEAQMKIDEI